MLLITVKASHHDSSSPLLPSRGDNNFEFDHSKVKLGSSLHKDLKSPSLTSLDDEDLSKSDDVSSSNTKDGRKLKDREVVKTSSSHAKDKNKPEMNPACLPRCNCEELMRVEAKLETKDLWEKFHELGTEMIITKTGRRYETYHVYNA